MGRARTGGVCWGSLVGEYSGCLLSGGESVRGRVIFTFLLAGLVHWGFEVL